MSTVISYHYVLKRLPSSSSTNIVFWVYQLPFRCSPSNPRIVNIVANFLGTDGFKKVAQKQFNEKNKRLVILSVDVIEDDNGVSITIEKKMKTTLLAHHFSHSEINDLPTIIYTRDFSVKSPAYIISVSYV